MKDNRFIELVNLYIDRQISAAEAADLEAEIQANPRRRAIYRQYCQMHRASTLVYESFRVDAPEQAEAGQAKGKIDPFARQARQRRSPWMYYAGGLAAACVALVFVRLNEPSTAGGNAPVAMRKATPPAAVVAARPSTPADTFGAPAESPAALVSEQANRLVGEQDYTALVAAIRQQEQRAFVNGQIQSNRLPSLFEDGVFEAPQGFVPNSQQSFRSKRTAGQQAEFTAFQFQR